MAEETTQTNSNSNSKVYKVLCYLGILWLIPYFVAKGEVRDENMILNLEQGFGTLLIFVIAQLLNTINFTGISAIVYMVALVLAIIGIINVVQNKDKELPIVGPFFTSSFSFIK